MSYKTLHSLFEIIDSKRSLVVLATLVLSGTLLAGSIPTANSIVGVYSSVSSKAPIASVISLSQTGPTTTAGNSSTISGKLKDSIKSLIDNESNAAIVIGLVDRNGTQFYGYGKMSIANQTTVDKNTVFDIGSITKSFTTLLLADMANRGIVNLNDSIGKYLPSTVKTPTYNGQQITLEIQHFCLVKTK
jgi:CubicO group peptidase (beta-lactamase class C family)